MAKKKTQKKRKNEKPKTKNLGAVTDETFVVRKNSRKEKK